jgi:hypothetical protein
LFSPLAGLWEIVWSAGEKSQAKNHKILVDGRAGLRHSCGHADPRFGRREQTQRWCPEKPLLAHGGQRLGRGFLGRQGLTICAAVAVIQLVVALLAGNAIYLIFGVASAIIFLMGRMGVREGSWPAAAMVFTLYVAGMLSGIVKGAPPGVLSIIVAAVLLSNLRASVLAATWKPAGEDEDKPTRFNESLTDFLSDQLPAKAWPVLRYVFFFAAAILLLLILAGLIALALARLGILKIPQP